MNRMGSGWVFSDFVSLQLTLWHIDLLRASVFVPLSNWIQTRIGYKRLELQWQAYTL